MRKRDTASSAIVFFLALFAFIESRKFHVWSAGEPGEGFFPLVLSVVLGALSIISLIVSARGSGSPRSAPAAGVEERPIWRKLVCYVAALLGYAFLFDYLGYLLSSLVALMFILRIAEGVGWARSLLITAGTLVISFILFSHILTVPLPSGILGWP